MWPSPPGMCWCPQGDSREQRCSASDTSTRRTPTCIDCVVLGRSWGSPCPTCLCLAAAAGPLDGLLGHDLLLWEVLLSAVSGRPPSPSSWYYLRHTSSFFFPPSIAFSLTASLWTCKCQPEWSFYSTSPTMPSFLIFSRTVCVLLDNTQASSGDSRVLDLCQIDFTPFLSLTPTAAACNCRLFSLWRIAVTFPMSVWSDTSLFSSEHFFLCYRSLLRGYFPESLPWYSQPGSLLLSLEDVSCLTCSKCHIKL